MKCWITGIVLIAAALTARCAEPLQAIVDDAWQGAQGYHFSGRITEVHAVPQKDSGRMAALYRTTRMLFTSGEEGLVTWRVADQEWTLRSSEHGYWELAGSLSLALAPGWHDIESTPAPSSLAGLLVVDPRNPIGIISDIDDTILITGVLHKGTLLKNSLTVAPEHRAAVPGMAELYRKLVQRNPAPEATAIFYISASPRQLTDNIRRFLAAGGFPRGVLQLRGTSVESGDVGKDHAAYKLRHIETILAAFPNLSFQFFGDNAERDPEIYAKIREKYPEQVAGIWIRHVNPDEKRATYPGQRDVSELKR